MRTDTLEQLYQKNQDDNGKQHHQIFIAVVTVVNGNFAQSATAYDTAHGGVA